MKPDRLLLAVLVLSLLVAAFTLYQRFEVERPYHRVELVADYEKFKELADSMGMPMRDVLDELKASGVTSVAIKEETLEKLRSRRTYIGYEPVGAYGTGPVEASAERGGKQD